MKAKNTKQAARVAEQGEQLRDATVSSVCLRAARVPAPAEVPTLATPGPAVDRAKVERLRAALEAGELKFDSELVAQRMIDQGEAPSD